MLTFKNITVRDAAMLRRYYENCDYALCEYSAGVKLMWRSALRYAWAEAAGCLIIRCESEGRVCNRLKVRLFFRVFFTA